MTKKKSAGMTRQIEFELPRRLGAREIACVHSIEVPLRAMCLSAMASGGAMHTSTCASQFEPAVQKLTAFAEGMCGRKVGAVAHLESNRLMIELISPNLRESEAAEQCCRYAVQTFDIFQAPVGAGVPPPLSIRG